MQAISVFQQHPRKAPPPPPALRGLLNVGVDVRRQAEAHPFVHSTVENPKSVFFGPLVEQRQIGAVWMPSKLKADLSELRQEFRDTLVGIVGRSVVIGHFTIDRGQGDDKRASALAFFDNLLRDTASKGYDKAQAKHLKAVQKSLDSHRRRGSKLFR